MDYTSGNYEAFARPRKPAGVDGKTAWFVGAGLASMSGAAFLIDANGWLRAVHRPGAAGGWLAGAIRDIEARPIQQLSGEPHEHHH